MSGFQIVGERTIGQCVPAALSANAQLLANLQPRVAGMIAAQAHAAVNLPTLQGRIDACVSLLARLRAQLALGLPSVSLNLTVMARLIASLQADIQAALALNISFGTAGVMVLAGESTVGKMGADLTTQVETLFPPQNNVAALVLLASDPATKIAMKAVFGVSFS